jgi:hypothetical protein
MSPGRRRAAVCSALAACAVLAGCGDQAADLLAIEVSGGPGGRPPHTLVVTDDGRGRCDTASLRLLPNERLLEAREVEREIEGPAREGRAYPGGTPGGRSYVLKTSEGVVRWREGAAGLPPALPKAAALGLMLERELCGS